MKLQHFIAQFLQTIDNSVSPHKPDPPGNKALLANLVVAILLVLVGIVFILLVNAFYVWIQSLTLPETPID